MSTANIIQQLNNNNNSTMIHHPDMIRQKARSQKSFRRVGKSKEKTGRPVLTVTQPLLKGVPTATAIVDDNDISVTDEGSIITVNFSKTHSSVERQQTICSSLRYLEDETQQKTRRMQLQYPAKSRKSFLISCGTSMAMSVSSGGQQQTQNYYNDYQNQYHQTEQLDHTSSSRYDEDYTSKTTSGSSCRPTTTSSNREGYRHQSSERAAICYIRERCRQQQQKSAPAFGFQRGLSSRSLMSNQSCGSGGSLISNHYNIHDHDQYTSYSAAEPHTPDYTQPNSSSCWQAPPSGSAHDASLTHYCCDCYHDTCYNNDCYGHYDDNDCYNSYDKYRGHATWEQQQTTTRDQWTTTTMPGNSRSYVHHQHPRRANPRSCTSQYDNKSRDQNSKPSTTYVEIMPGVEERLRSSSETLSAIENDFYRPVSCFGCSTELLCISDASYVLCPDCRVVSPMNDNHVDVDNCGSSSTAASGGVGMGFKYDDLFQWQSEIIMQQQQHQRY